MRNSSLCWQLGVHLFLAAANRVIGPYQDLLEGRENPSAAWKILKATAQLGVTEGTLVG